MLIRCPHCRQSIELGSRKPGKYAFKCPKCTNQVAVGIPEEPGKSPDVFLLKPEPATPPIGSPALKPASDDVTTSHKEAAREQGGERKNKRIPGPENDSADENQEPRARRVVPDDTGRDENEGSTHRINEADSSRPPHHKRKRKKKKTASAGQLVAPLLVALGVWIALVVAAFLFRPVVYGLLILGSIVTFMGRSTFLQVAREDGMGTWLACLFVPFYSTYYFFTRMGRTLVPFLIGCCGYVFLGSGIVLWFVHLSEPAAEADEERPEHEVAGLAITVAGKPTAIPIEEMNYFHVKRGREEYPDSFEFSGPGTSIRGTFALGFDEAWEKLVGKPVKILARSEEPEDGDSEITLPSRGVVKITGGSFTIERVVSPRPEPVLRGRIQLHLAGSGGLETVDGTFEVRVNGWY
jgi:hypothetical protein